ncbi:MAG: hypothetical protein RLO80_00870 [Hyphomonas sp.]
MSDAAVPEGRETRTRLALGTALEALKLAQREAVGAAQDKAHWGWVALGLVTALQAALVAGLSGYETAAVEAVQNPSQPERIASGSLLMRRASSAAFLNLPERVDLSGSQLRAVQRVVAVRNAAVHSLGLVLPRTFAADALEVVRLLQHLVLDAPAFDARKFSMQTIFLRDTLAGLARALGEIKPA